jgi:hypothetical protein
MDLSLSVKTASGGATFLVFGFGIPNENNFGFAASEEPVILSFSSFAVPLSSLELASSRTLQGGDCGTGATNCGTLTGGDDLQAAG